MRTNTHTLSLSLSFFNYLKHMRTHTHIFSITLSQKESLIHECETRGFFSVAYVRRRRKEERIFASYARTKAYKSRFDLQQGEGMIARENKSVSVSEKERVYVSVSMECVRVMCEREVERESGCV